jgi:phosphopentomutase
MNIAEPEVRFNIVAKLGRINETTKQIIYSFSDSYHHICMDKSELLLSELIACEELLKYTINGVDRKILQTEISRLRLAKDTLHSLSKSGTLIVEGN